MPVFRSSRNQARRANVSDFRSGFGVVDPTNKEIISWTFWERLTYTSASTVTLTAFAAVPANLEDGNLTGAGQLDQGHSFLAMAFRLAPAPNVTETAAAVPAAGNADGALQDIASLIYNGSYEITVLSKSYGRWPIFMAPAGGGPWGFFGNVGTLTAVASAQYQLGVNGVPDARNVYSLPVPIAIPPQTNFRLKLTFRSAQTLTNGNTPIYAMLDGLLMRPVQ